MTYRNARCYEMDYVELARLGDDMQPSLPSGASRGRPKLLEWLEVTR